MDGETSSNGYYPTQNLGSKLEHPNMFNNKKLSFARSVVSTETPDFIPEFNFIAKPPFLDSTRSKQDSSSPDPKLFENEGDLSKGFASKQNDDRGTQKLQFSMQSEFKGKLGEMMKKQQEHDKEAAGNFKKIMNLLKSNIKNKFKNQDKIDGYQSFLEEKKQQD
mmetsp:Transcript_13467/g.21041  ORF Transcript_13467/g.21041 Transcript_13467/m.21041 type:complete len:164 (-) Transcript_13467:5562-6053(-)